MVKTKKKEVQKQGLRPSQKAKAEKLLKKQAAKKAAADLLSVNENEAQSIVSATESETQPSLSAAAEKKTRAKVAISLTKDKKIVRKVSSAATVKKTTRTTARKSAEEEQPQVKETAVEDLTTITVKNAEGDPDTTAEILIQNKIDYTPKVSVIIPVYNVEPYLRECLDSVINQTLKEIEIICVDDGSTDASLEILKEYAEKDNRITVITQKNLYAGVARNAGLAVAKGEYLSFLDSDDFFEPTLFEETYNLAEKEQSQIVFYQYKNYDNDLQQCDENPRGISKRLTNEEYITVTTNSLKENLFTLCNPMPWNKLIKHSLAVGENLHYQALKASNDVCFSLNILACAEKITLYYKSLVYYRHNRRDSLKNTRDKAPLNFYEAYKGIYNTLTSKGLYEKYKKTFLTSLVSSCLWTLRNTDEQHNFVKDFIKNNIIPEFSLLDDGINFLEENRLMFLKNLYMPDIIISLTSYPARIPTLHLVIDSLLNQSAYADKVILWLAPEQFPNKEADLPQELLTLKNKGLTIGWYKDIRSYKKLIPTLKLYPNAIIVTADDDNIYQRDWLKKLVDSYIEYPSDIQAHRVTKFHYANNRFYTVSGGREYYNGANYLNKLVGLGGVLYPPHCFYKDILDEDLIKKLAPTNDDQWFWLQAAMNGVRVRVVENPIIEAHLVEGTQETGLTNINDHGENLFWKDFNRILEYYPIITEILREEDKRNISRYKNDSPYREELEHWYERLHHKKLNLNNPQTFNEKIQWLKLYASTPIKTRLADKYLVRDWVKETIGEKYLIPLLGVYNSFDEIDFEELPNQFVIKCNHGSGYNIIVKDKSQIDMDEIRSKLTRWMNENFAFRVGTELQYKNMQPKIIIEQMIKNEKSEDLNDYKFYCFNGVVKYVQVISERVNGTHKVSFYDMNWTKQPWWDNVFYEGDVKKPKKFDEMVMLAEKMCQGFCFVRVDLYYLDTNEIYFGEMTFSPSSGGMRWSSEAINLRLGKMINLPKLAYDVDADKYYKPKRISLLKQYFMLPFYLSKINMLRNIKAEKVSEYMINELLGMRIDVKNVGDSCNSVNIVSDSLSVSSPKWFADSNGVGKMLQGCSVNSTIKIRAINSGVLKIIFKGQDRRYNGKRLPLWIDYKSIKIDGMELLHEPKEVWHDEPYRYEMPVSDRQEVIVKIEQQYHKYTENELKNLLFKLNYDKEYIKENIECTINLLKNRFIIDEETNRKRNFEKCIKNIITTLTSYRIDIKNLGDENDDVEISVNDGCIEMPKWFTNAQGKGRVVQGNILKSTMRINAINDGVLTMSFRGQEKKYNDMRISLWIDYKSIKIDGKEILSEPVATWHDKPYHYEMSVKDGQEITLEVEQQYHEYTENELKDVLLKLNPDSDYIKENINVIITEMKKYFPVIDETEYKKRQMEATISEIIADLTSYRLDIKNLGTEINKIVATVTSGIIEEPKWLANAQGMGVMLQDNKLINTIKLKAVNDGKLRMDFRGQDKKYNGERIPIWVDYKSIKIDSKEILQMPVTTWHDKPYRHEIPVKDGQEITLEIEQQYHQYSEYELKDIIEKLYPNDEFIKENIDEIVEKVLLNIGGGYLESKINDYPQITADCFIPIGSACRPAYWLMKSELRYCSLPFDWMMNFPLSTIISTLKHGISDWFNEYVEDKNKIGKKARYVTDIKNRIISMHGFPVEKTVDEYMTEFKELFGRRYERMKDILKTSKSICLICNRNDDVYNFQLFLQEIAKMYPKLQIKLLNIRHSDLEQEIIKYEINPNVIFYNIEAHDIHKNGNDKSNPSFWIGNEDLWNEVCSHLSLSDSVKTKLEKENKDKDSAA